MRPTWKGSISFGLVYIPIAVYPATREEKLSFRQLRRSDLSPIKYKKVAEADAKEVPADQIVKGFEYERGRYIVMNDEDFEKVRIESTHSIDITDFVDLGQVDPKFFYKPYFLEPQKGGEKAYALLHKALTNAALNEKELKMAQALVDSMSVPWEPEKYRDEYRSAVMDLIEQKAKNKKIDMPAMAPRPTTNVVDLVKVLQESLNRSQSVRVKRGGDGARRSTSSLVKQKRRAAA